MWIGNLIGFLGFFCVASGSDVNFSESVDPSFGVTTTVLHASDKVGVDRVEGMG